jgi:hypothetical protein
MYNPYQEPVGMPQGTNRMIGHGIHYEMTSQNPFNSLPKVSQDERVFIRPGTIEFENFMRYLDHNFRSGNAKNICCNCWIISPRHQLMTHKAIGHRIVTPRHCKDL